MGSTGAAFVKILRDASPHFIAAHDEIKPRFPSCRDSRSVPKSIGENKRRRQLGGFDLVAWWPAENAICQMPAAGSKLSKHRANEPGTFGWLKRSWKGTPRAGE